MKHKIKRIFLLIFVVLISFYALNWVVYLLEFYAAKNTLVDYYHSQHPTYPCVGGMTTANNYAPISIEPRSYITPSLGVAFFVQDGPSGYVQPFGAIIQEKPGMVCLLQ
jgi:hypothetical protein